MLEMKHISIIFSVIGIVVLYFVSLLAEPVYIELTEIDSYEGKEVIVEGTVIEKHETRYGNQILKIKDAKSTEEIDSIIVFVEKAKPDIEYGDRLSIQGIVQRYQGEIEIFVSDNKQIKIIEKWNNISIPLRIIAQDPHNYINLNLKILGKIEKIYHTYILLEDLEENQKIRLLYDAERLDKNVTEGDVVLVEAKLEYNTDDLNYFLDGRDYNISKLKEE
jgi:hypothetical protein